MDLLVIKPLIYEVREKKVMFDDDLARLYGVQTKVLNQAVKRNIKRFPEEFMFTLTEEEWSNLRSQIVTSGYGGRRYLPKVFTEHGITMLASVLSSDKAIEVNIAIVKAFISLRQMAIQYHELAKRLEELESNSDLKFNEIYNTLNYLLEEEENKQKIQERNRIGYI